MTNYPPPVRERDPHSDLSPAWAATVATGFVLLLLSLAAELFGHATNAPGIVQTLDLLVEGELLIPLRIGLFALGTVVQGHRCRWLRHHGYASAGPRRTWDWALAVLGAIALIPALEPHPDKLTDTTPLFTSGLLDSIASLQLVTFLEQEFGIKVAAHEVVRADQVRVQDGQPLL